MTHDTITNYTTLTEIDHPNYMKRGKWEMYSLKKQESNLGNNFHFF
jgi:hypothetical protein